MECSEKLVWTDYTKEELLRITVGRPDYEIRKKVLENWDNVAKPIDGMGRFESVTARIGAILGTDDIDISKKAVLIMCADNGIVEEGISQSGQEVTLAVAKEMAEKKSSVGKMASWIGADTVPVDIGINSEEQIPGVLNRKIRRGTRNFLKEPAMTEEETVKAVAAGIELAGRYKAAGYRLLATGEMGIGNTTTSSTVTAALLKCEPAAVTGRGAGLTDEKLAHKRRTVRAAIEKYGLYDAEPFEVLRTVGGLDIAGLCGVCIGGALFHVPVVLDGVISMVSALAAERLVPGVKDYLIPSHRGKEPAVNMLAEELEMEPVIEADLALGEGSGAVMMMGLLDMALCVYNNRTTFSDIQIGQYERYETT